MPFATKKRRGPKTDSAQDHDDSASDVDILAQQIALLPGDSIDVMHFYIGLTVLQQSNLASRPVC